MDERTGRPYKRPRFTRYDVDVYRRWLIGRALHATWLPGALSEQNPWDLERWMVLEMWERGREREDGVTAMQMGVLGMFGKRK